MRAAFARRPVFAYASALAAGVVVGVFLVSGLGDPSPPRGSDVSGTLLAGRLGGLGAPDAHELVLDGLRVEATTRLGQGIAVALLRLEGKGTAEVTLEFDPQRLPILGFERSGEAAGPWELVPGRLSLTGAVAGSYRLVLALNRPAGPLRLSVTRNGATEDRTLAVGRLP
jgi:hypothetical protein